MYGLVDENGEYDEDAVQQLQEQLAEAAGPQEDPRDSTRHDMIFHWVVFVAGFIVAVAGGVSKTLDTLQWGWDNTVLANISGAPRTAPHAPSARCSASLALSLSLSLFLPLFLSLSA